MSINITALYKMQFQMLKPLSPRQEYALVVLLVDGLKDGDVAEVNSKKHLPLQVMDVVLGAMCFRLNACKIN